MMTLSKKLYYLPDDIYLYIFSYINIDNILNILDINTIKKNNILLNKYLYLFYKNKIDNLYFGNLFDMKIFDYMVQVFNNKIYINNNIKSKNNINLLIENNFNNLFIHLFEKEINMNVNPIFEDIFIKKYVFSNKKIEEIENECIKYNNYDILNYVTSRLDINNYDKITKKLFSGKINDKRYIMLYKYLSSNIDYIQKETIKRSIIYHEEKYFNKLLQNKYFDLIILLINYIKNNRIEINIIDESYYLELFIYYGKTVYDGYGNKRNFNSKTIIKCEINLDKNKLFNDFIDKLNFLENININLSFSNFKYFLKNLYINKEDIEESTKYNYYFIPSPEIKNMKFNLLKHIFSKYNNYFQQPYFYFIDLIENENYYMIKYFYKLNYYFDEKTYKYILENTNSIHIIKNLIKYEIIKKDILFCKYYAAKNILDKFIFLCENKFEINDSIMDIAIYNLSFDIIKYLYKNFNMRLNDNRIDILNNYIYSDNYYKKNIAENIFKYLSQ